MVIVFEGSVIMHIIGCVDVDGVGFGILLTWERIGGLDLAGAVGIGGGQEQQLTLQY